MKIGFLAGAFDVIHPGYIKMFKEASDNCNYLVVGLHNNPNLERKNKLKPILSVKDREEILLAIKYINKVLIYDTEDELLILLKKLKPAVRFLGNDYIEKEFTGKELNIPIHIINRDHEWSTTYFKNKIFNQIKYDFSIKRKNY